MTEIRVLVAGSGRMAREVAAAVRATPGMSPVGFVRTRDPGQRAQRVQSTPMTDTRVLVSGSGRMGREVAAAVLAEPGMSPIGYVDGLAEPGVLEGIPLFKDAAAACDQLKPDVVIDFTNAAWTPALAEACIPRGVRMVIGTTGLSAAFMAWLESESAARKTGAVVAANFAIGAVLMMHFARQAARFFDYAEIIELHHDKKVDSPSGTAKTTAELMRAARDRDFIHPESEKEPLPGARGAQYGGVAIHSVRLPGLVAHQEVLFGGLGQTLTIRHDTTGRDSFMPGVIAATREVMKLDRLVLGLDALFGLD
ncbi:4-hydroxy-tetrahydrodipicolinate reductase [Candidatus Amarobacter glycogenicus]|uniref:4-hydroxy-tetrahydrodipicolinate reductase n=1 Tax=Candidatus Amarobacter glycogenicus TaxID=3140699 RepID=UPI0031CC9DA5